MASLRHKLVMDGRTFHGLLTESPPDDLTERVKMNGKEVHAAVFPARMLGGADRREYLRTVVHTIATKMKD